MKNKDVIKYLIKEEVLKLLREEEAPLKPVLTFEEDPVNFILAKYPSLKETLTMLLTGAFKDYITGIYIIAPKPTTFKIVLHNGQSFYLRYLGRAYEAKVVGRRYYLLTVGDKERAIQAIAGLLELGQPIGTQGPEAETTSTEGTEEAAPAAEETPPSQEKEEETES
jgi:hypothetical protein